MVSYPSEYQKPTHILVQNYVHHVNTNLEERQHFMGCDNIERWRLFEALHQNLTAIAVKFTLHPSLLTALWLGLLAIRMNTQYPNISNKTPQEITSAIQSQNWLRWGHLYQGRFSKKWAHAIDKLHPTLALSGWKITTLLIHEIWKYVLKTWSVQNCHLPNDQGHLSVPDYCQAVQTMYKTRHQLPAETQEALFSRPIEQLLEQSPEFLHKWIVWSNKYIKQQLWATKKRVKLHTPDIQSFFGPCTPVANDLHPPFKKPIHLFYVLSLRADNIHSKDPHNGLKPVIWSRWTEVLSMWKTHTSLLRNINTIIHLAVAFLHGATQQTYAMEAW